MSNPARPVTGTPIDTAWGLAVADSVVRVYPNAATRDADLAGVSSSELLGQVVVLTDTGSLLVYVGPVMGWRKPWNLPWGVLASVTSVLDVTGTASPQSILSAPPVVDLVAGRSYRFSAIGTITNTTPSQLNITIPTGSYVGRVLTFGAGEFSMSVMANQAVSTSSPSSTVNLMIVGTGIVGKGSMAPHRLMVEDVGPFANPTALSLDDAGELVLDVELLDDVARAILDAGQPDLGPGELAELSA